MSTSSQFLGSGVKSKQSGVIAVSGGSGTATITAVDTSKSGLVNLGLNGGALGANVAIVLTNSTTITATGQDCNVSWELKESY